VLRDEPRSPALALRRDRKRLFETYWLPKLAAGGVGVLLCPLHGANCATR